MSFNIVKWCTFTEPNCIIYCDLLSVVVSLWTILHLSLLGLYLGGKYCFRRLNGLTSGVMTVVKGCLLRPLQERWTQSNTEKDFCSSAFDYISFEPRYLNWFKKHCLFYFFYGFSNYFCFIVVLFKNLVPLYL